MYTPDDTHGECDCCRGAAAHPRRRFLKLGLGLGAATLAPTWGVHARDEPDRILHLHNLHTGERVQATYWSQGAYRPDGLAALNHVLRDHRADEATDMDPELLDILFRMQDKLDTVGKEVQIISGYRSPATNEKLRQQGRNVAKRSLHTLGKAMDVRLPYRPLSRVHRTALNLEAGGVGYYPRSEFIHIDVGRVRRWGG